MELFTPIPPETAGSLALALIVSSQAPLLLLDRDLVVQAASASFCRAFGLDPETMSGSKLGDIGAGEWNGRTLQSLLLATVAGSSDRRL